jgi:polyhydroxybutyrate depolymerase
MTKHRLLVGAALLATVAITIAAAARAQRADPDPTRITAPGDYRFSFSHDGMARFYLVHVPKSYRPGSAAPMLIALHGGGGSADYQANDSKYRLISKSDQAGFIAVFPNGYSRFGGRLATWNAGGCCAGAVRNNVDDVGFIREVIRRMERQASIDPRRIFATGMSNGAMMSWRLACDAPEIRGIAPVEGTDNTSHCTPSHPVPIIEFHSVDDDMVPFNGGVGPRSFTRLNFNSVPASIAKWVGLNRADPQARRVLTVPGAHCDLHPAKRGGAPVELCVTDTGGHSWPGGGTQQGRKQPSMAISANDLMWAFFSSL